MLPHTDYVLVCIKAVDPAKYKLITGCEQHSVLDFINQVCGGDGDDGGGHVVVMVGNSSFLSETGGGGKQYRTV